MTRQRAKEFAPIVEAWGNGKAIQRRQHEKESWEDVEIEDPYFGTNGWFYRIKPEPRRLLVLFNDNGGVDKVFGPGPADFFPGMEKCSEFVEVVK
jgi:hypothetical protein